MRAREHQNRRPSVAVVTKVGPPDIAVCTAERRRVEPQLARGIAQTSVGGTIGARARSRVQIASPDAERKARSQRDHAVGLPSLQQNSGNPVENV